VTMKTDENVLQGRQVGEEADVLIGSGNPQPDNLIRQEANEGGVVEKDFSNLGTIKACHTVEKGGFPGSIGSNDTVDAMLFNFKVEIIDSKKTAEPFGHLVSRENRHKMLFFLLRRRSH
jgi:hypothetical protein